MLRFRRAVGSGGVLVGLVLVLCGVPAAWCHGAGGEPPGRNPSSSPMHPTVCNGRLYFAADDGIHGRELFAADASSRVTLAVDLCPGPGASNPDSLHAAGRWIYFVADVARDSRWGFLLDTETLVARPLEVGGARAGRPAPRFLGATPEQIYAATTTGMGEHHLWVVEAERGAAAMVKTVAIPTREYFDVRTCVASDGSLFYYEPGGLFRLDPGTREVAKVVAFRGAAALTLDAGIAAIGERVVFIGEDEEHGQEPWVVSVDGSGAHLLRDIAPGRTGSDVQRFFPCDGKLFFGADDGSCGKELWVTDGTGEGTRRVLDIHPGVAQSNPHYWAAAGGAACFLANDGRHGKEVWRSDGTAEGTTMVCDLAPGPLGSDPWQVTGFGDRLAFCAASPVYGEEVFLTDGTAAGTRVLRDIVPGAGSSGPHQLAVLDGRLFFTCDDGAHGEELWVSDGTAEGTRLAADIALPVSNPSSDPACLTLSGGRVFFAARDRDHGREVWVTDGVDTRVACDLVPGRGDSSPAALTTRDGGVCFRARDADGATGWWETDGTPEGTVWLGERPPLDDEPAVRPVEMGGYRYFSRQTAAHGAELWREPLAGGEAALVVDAFPGPASASPDCLTPMGNRLYFVAEHPVEGRVLWRTEGGPDTTTAVLMPGLENMQWPYMMRVEGLVAVGDVLVLSGEARIHVEVSRVVARRTNLHAIQCGGGREEHTHCLLGGADDQGCHPAELVRVGDRVFFSADDGYRGRELWVSDGTVAGTRLVADLLGPADLSPLYGRTVAAEGDKS